MRIKRRDFSTVTTNQLLNRSKFGTSRNIRCKRGE
ncbi:Uncharacterised protein [Vibrio cholerae]|nr:Uncharacterised protein [Vibrio cholerae]